jgi:arylsulfatase A-like enzyme
MVSHLRCIRILAVAVAGTVLAAVGCQKPRDRTAPLNVLLISIDSLRADHVGCYGYERDTTPEIDAFAASAVLFESAVSQAPWTLPAHASLLTSLYARSHQVQEETSRLAEGTPTIAGVLSRNGYDTAAVVSGPFMKSLFGLDAGFAHYDDSIAAARLESHSTVTSPAVHEKVVALLERLDDPFFLFVHYWDVHYDYIPPEPFDRLFDPDYAGTVDARDFETSKAIHRGMEPRDLQHVVALYDGEVRYVDSFVGRLFAELRSRGLFETTLIVLTADHGEEFFEHGEKGHCHTTYNELIHVPLIIRWPGNDGRRRVERRVQHVDIVPTILDIVGADTDGLALHGQSLVPLLRGDPDAARPAFAETTRFRRKKKWGVPFGRAQCVIDGRYKLIRHPEGSQPDELYDLLVDSGEENSLELPKVSRRLSTLMDDWESSAASGPRVDHEGLDEDTRRQLEQLGYIEE